MTENKTFPLEKILNADLKAFKELNHNINLKLYLPVGVHAEGVITNGDEVINRFAKKVPSDAVAVINYLPQKTYMKTGGDLTNYFSYVATGTAIVPKK